MLARKSTLIMATNIIEAILAYVALFFIARYMGPEDYGIIGFAIGFVGLFALLCNLGFNEAHVKRISEGKDLGKCIGTFAAIKVGLVGLMSIAAISAVFFWKFVLNRGFESNNHEIAIFIIIGYFILERISTIFKSTYVAETKIAKAHIPIFVATVFRTGAIIFVAISGFGPIELALAYIFGHVFLFITNLLLFRNYTVKKPSKAYFNDYLAFAMPLIIVSASSTIMTNIDKVLIQLFWSAEEVGYYFASFRICGFIVLAGTSIGQILFPTISDYHSKKKFSRIKEIIFQSERYISLITFPMVFGISVLAEPSINILLSGSFNPAIPVFMILPFFALINALTIPYNSIFLGTNNPKLARNMILIMAFFNVLLNLILIPKDIQILGIKLFGLGATGAAIATVTSYTIGLIYCRIVAWKLVKIKFNSRILLHLFAASIMGIILYLIHKNEVISILRWYDLLGVGLLGLGIYIGILVILKEFTKKDLKFLFDTLNLKKMWKYIVKEIKRE
jgi:O-antigen/teichoic acid export membrane protein